MAQQYAYKYAILDTDPTYYGQCIEIADTTTYILDPMHVPVTDIDTVDFTLKWYYPIPETVTSFDDFQGLFYHDDAHTQPYVEGNEKLV